MQDSSNWPPALREAHRTLARRLHSAAFGAPLGAAWQGIIEDLGETEGRRRHTLRRRFPEDHDAHRVGRLAPFDPKVQRPQLEVSRHEESGEIRIRSVESRPVVRDQEFRRASVARQPQSAFQAEDEQDGNPEEGQSAEKPLLS